jgi:hypothetical protein
MNIDLKQGSLAFNPDKIPIYGVSTLILNRVL